MSEVMLRAEEHFEALRGPVWARFRGRHPLFSRDRFDDAYQEFWARELQRAWDGRSSTASAPVAFVTEAVHRVLIDEGRARARGIGRDEKHRLAVEGLDDHLDVAGEDDTAAGAHFEAIVHRVLGLVRDRLTERELQVFVSSFLYLQSTEQTAAALGLSAPRVKKDRKRIAAKCGEAVWPVLAGELACSAAASEKGMAAAFEVMTDHVESCSSCAGLRRGAMAVVGPVELLALAPAPGGEVLDVLTARVFEIAQRFTELATTVPPAGRSAAVAGVAAAALAGTGVTAERTSEPQARAPARVAPPQKRPAAARPLRVQRTTRPRRIARPPQAQPAAAPATPAPPAAQPPRATAARSAPESRPGEFGFEQP
jgi:DNA-directed RNA polymerase specialized sigma24 family protein